MSSPLRRSMLTIVAAHYEAFDSLAIRHGDVSGGNALIYSNFLQGNDGWVSTASYRHTCRLGDGQACLYDAC